MFLNWVADNLSLSSLSCISCHCSTILKMRSMTIMYLLSEITFKIFHLVCSLKALHPCSSSANAFFTYSGHWSTTQLLLYCFVCFKEPNPLQGLFLLRKFRVWTDAWNEEKLSLQNICRITFIYFDHLRKKYFLQDLFPVCGFNLILTLFNKRSFFLPEAFNKHQTGHFCAMLLADVIWVFSDVC